MLREKLSWLANLRPFILPGLGIIIVLILVTGQLYFFGDLSIFTGVQNQSQKNLDQALPPSHSPSESTITRTPQNSAAESNSPSSKNLPSPLPLPQTSNSETTTSLKTPIRAAFYYGWYSEQWTDAGHRYTPTLGFYNSANTSVIATHIDEMKFARIQSGIYSWWGQGSDTDKRFPSFLNEAKARNFYWTIYFELDYNGKRTLAEITSDMNYLKNNYFGNPGYLHVNNKPVVFVYMPQGGGCNQVNKWTYIRNQFSLYVNMMDVPEWWNCNTLDSWHGYKPDSYTKPVYVNNTVYSISASAGFWAAWESIPRLVRDFTQWENAVKVMVYYKPGWQLVYFNEFGEGSNIEPSDVRCEEINCFDYLNVLNQTY